jgi:hypothetical protein
VQWSNHVSITVKKANKALNANKIIGKYFNTKELLHLLMSNFYSILYNDIEVWHLRILKQSIKISLISASANVLTMVVYYPKVNSSFYDL